MEAVSSANSGLHYAVDHFYRVARQLAALRYSRLELRRLHSGAVAVCGGRIRVPGAHFSGYARVTASASGNPPYGLGCHRTTYRGFYDVRGED